MFSFHTKMEKESLKEEPLNKVKEEVKDELLIEWKEMKEEEKHVNDKEKEQIVWLKDELLTEVKVEVDEENQQMKEEEELSLNLSRNSDADTSYISTAPIYYPTGGGGKDTRKKGPGRPKNYSNPNLTPKICRKDEKNYDPDTLALLRNRRRIQLNNLAGSRYRQKEGEKREKREMELRKLESRNMKLKIKLELLKQQIETFKTFVLQHNQSQRPSPFCGNKTSTL